MPRVHSRVLAPWLALAITVACGSSHAPAPTAARTITVTPPESSGSSEPEDAPPPEPRIEDGAQNELAFSLPALNSQSEAGLRPGVVNVVAFGASWCGPCEMLYPSLDALYQREKSWLSVVILQEDDERASAERAVTQLGLRAPAVWDENGTVAKSWKPQTLPSIYVLDRHGKVRFRHDGYTPDVDATLAREARSLAAER